MRQGRLIVWCLAWGAGFWALPAAAEIPAKPGSGESFRDCADCPEMVVAPAGSFAMGSPEAEPDRMAQEGPQHTGDFPEPFAVGRFAVTFAEWDACAADGGCGGYKPGDQGWGRGNRPVVNVDWNDAKAYVQWLSKKTGKPYRLLSEAEREYGRGPVTATPFWWGSAITPVDANYDGNYIYGGGGEGENRRADPAGEIVSSRTLGGSIRFTAMSGNGARIAATVTYDGAPADGSPGCPATAAPMSCAAALEWTIRWTSAPPTASPTSRSGPRQ